MFGSWDYRRRAIVLSGIMQGGNGFTVVSQDADFAEMATLLRTPPKVIWLRVGKQLTAMISTLLRHHADLIVAFEKDDDATCLEIYEPK
jgi:predicted nuclease of predicted toxin-antitoxin system